MAVKDGFLGEVNDSLVEFINYVKVGFAYKEYYNCEFTNYGVVVFDRG
jgi:hypothetical protein